MFTKIKIISQKDKKESCCTTTINKTADNASCKTTNSEGCCVPHPNIKAACPKCGEKAKGVLAKTLEHLLTKEAKAKLSCLDGFYYCKTSSCDVVYFKGDDVLIQKDLSVVVGLKDGASPATVCYCFDWTKEKIRAELQESKETTALEDIKAKMKDPGCSCEILNPSGGCCLTDVTKAIKEIKKGLEL